MLGLIVNFIAVIAGSSVGLLLKKGISEKIEHAVMIGIGICVVYMGITGLSAEVDTIVILLALAAGAMAGTAMDIDAWLNRMGTKVEKKLVKGDSDSRLTEGMVNFFLMSCTGAYCFMASINAGLGDHEMLLTKSMMDVIVSMMLSSTLGIGVMLAAIPITIYQGILALFAGLIAPILVGDLLDAFGCAGSLLTMVIGINMMGISNIKVANYLPALIFAPLFAWVAMQF